MNNWDTIFSSALNSRLYNVQSAIEEDSIKASANRNNLLFIDIDLAGITDKQKLLKEIAMKLGFPSYFGMNWDALYDCLTDMGDRTTSGYVILIKKFNESSKILPHENRELRKILISAAEYWKKKNKSFYIILAG